MVSCVFTLEKRRLDIFSQRNDISMDYADKRQEVKAVKERHILSTSSPLLTYPERKQGQMIEIVSLAGSVYVHALLAFLH